MSHRGWIELPTTYLEMPEISGSLLENGVIRDIARTARNEMRLPFVALSLGSTHFSIAQSLFVRDALLSPQDFTPCIITAARMGVFTVPHCGGGWRGQADAPQLIAYAGCAVPDRDGNCIGVFYMMDKRPRRFSSASLARLRAYTHLITSQIEIIRRFGIAGPDPSPQDIVTRADQFAGEGDHDEARKLVALAYAAHDIERLRQQCTAGACR